MRRARTLGVWVPVPPAGPAQDVRGGSFRGKSRHRPAQPRCCASNQKSCRTSRRRTALPLHWGLSQRPRACGRIFGRGLLGRTRTVAAVRRAPTNKKLADPVAEPCRAAVAVKETIERAAFRGIAFGESVHQPSSGTVACGVFLKAFTASARITFRRTSSYLGGARE